MEKVYLTYEDLCNLEEQYIAEAISALKQLRKILHKKNKIVKNSIEYKKASKIPRDEEQRDYMEEFEKEKEELDEQIINMPSERYCAWQEKNVDEWRGIDLIGYYAAKYFDTYNEEDTDLCRKRLKMSTLVTAKRFINTYKIDYADYIDWFFENCGKGKLKWIENISVNVALCDSVYKAYRNKDRKSSRGRL